MPDSHEPSDVVSLSAELHGEIGVTRSQVVRFDPVVESLRRRISYFMLFRLLLLALFTLAAAYWTWFDAHELGAADWIGWIAITTGYVISLIFAWQLRPKRDVLMSRQQLRTIGWAQSLFDLGLSLVAVLITGGVSSDFVFLFPIAVLGAATMGHRGQIITIAAASTLFYVAVSMGQFLGVLTLIGAKVSPHLDAPALWLALLRTSGAILLVAMLSDYLNTQLLSSVSQVKSLRTLNENIVRSLSSGLITVDQNGLVLFANPTASQLLGQSGPLLGHDCEELLPGLRAHLDDSGGLRNRFELDLRRPDDNREVHIGLSCSALSDEYGQFLGHIVNFQDVTELREMERVMRRNERLAAIGTLAASVAHEVRNPLAAISGCAELLDTDVSEDDQRLIKVIRSETARLADIVTELLDYTRPRKLERTRLDLAQALIELGDSFRADPSNANIDLVVEVPEQAVEAEIDISQLTQVLWNLVRNGAQAMDGEGRLDLSLTTAGAERLVIEVRDRGCGIPAANLDQIFDPFFSTKSGGTGIGLALVHRIIEEHGGAIAVDSSPGEGTCFTLSLPREPA